MQRVFSARPGNHLVSIQLPNGTPIRGVTIDNPSGGWLYVVELLDYVPPYTLRWSSPLEFAGTAITVRYGIAPAGLLSTVQGDSYVVTLDDEIVGRNTGVPAQPFISKQEQPDILEADVTIAVSGAAPGQAITNLMAGGTIKNKRLRIFAVSVFDDLQTAAPQPGTSIDERVVVQVSAADFTTTNPVPPEIAMLQLDFNHLRDQKHFTLPLDLALGADVGFFAFPIQRRIGGAQPPVMTFYGHVLYAVV